MTLLMKQKKEDKKTMKKERVHTDNAPAAVGPYSQAIKSNGFLYCSGQIPLVPSTMKIVEGGINEQTTQVLENLKAVIEAAGAKMNDVVKCTVLLQDIADFQKVNAVYAEYFPADSCPPARAAYQVSALPLGVQVEIEAIVAL